MTLESIKQVSKLKPFIGPAISTIVVIIIINRVKFLRDLVYGTA